MKNKLLFLLLLPLFTYCNTYNNNDAINKVKSRLNKNKKYHVIRDSIIKISKCTKKEMYVYVRRDNGKVVLDTGRPAMEFYLKNVRLSNQISSFFSQEEIGGCKIRSSYMSFAYNFRNTEYGYFFLYIR